MAAGSSLQRAIKLLLGLALVLSHLECGCLAQKEKNKNLDEEDGDDTEEKSSISCQICPDGVPLKFADVMMTSLTTYEIREKDITCSEFVQEIRQEEEDGTRACNIFLISAAVHCGCPPPHPDSYQDTRCPICSNGHFVAPERLNDRVGGVNGFRWVGQVEGSQPTCGDLVSSASLMKRTKKQCAAFQDAADAYCGCLLPQENDTESESGTTSTTPTTSSSSSTTTTTTTVAREPPSITEHNVAANPPATSTRQTAGLKRNAAIGMGAAGAFAILAVVALWLFVGGVCTKRRNSEKGDEAEPDTDEEEVILTEKMETATAELDDGSIEVKPKGGPAAWL